MIKNLLKYNFLKHFFVTIIFIVTSVLFFSPIIEGKKILQNDIIQYTGMSKELKDFRKHNNAETYWVIGGPRHAR